MRKPRQQESQYSRPMRLCKIVGCEVDPCDHVKIQRWALQDHRLSRRLFSPSLHHHRRNGRSAISYCAEESVNLAGSSTKQQILQRASLQGHQFISLQRALAASRARFSPENHSIMMQADEGTPAQVIGERLGVMCRWAFRTALPHNDGSFLSMQHHSKKRLNQGW